ncbi:MAG: DUF4276 family protein [Gallionella sp.]|nr:DUF4276 family protein [Gallionella sp.]
MKVAVFVEGLTELEFVQTLIKVICGRRAITFEILKQYKGSLVVVRVEPTSGATTHVTIVNCCSDEQVKTRMRDAYSSLVIAGYTYIIGLRDAYPYSYTDIPKIQASLSTGVPTQPIPAEMHLAIMEVESWFLDEVTHFKRIDPILTHNVMQSSGFDVVNTMGYDWVHPAQTLDDIYRVSGKRYRKKFSHIQRTVNALSPEELYVSVRARSPSFDKFLTGLEAALF